ncbi:MAG: DUF308 domain-containing protein [Bacteroidales bacterium]|nr:DUF308 domain-containing protein [Bacteroidales bacterium]
MLNKVVRSMATMLVGFLLVFLPESAMGLIIRVVGAAFFLPALISAIRLYMSRNQVDTMRLIAIAVIDLGSMVFGVWLMVAPTTFAELFITLLGIALLVFAVFQVFVVYSAQKYRPMHWGFLITPFLLAVAAIIVLANPFGTLEAVSVMLGICAIVSGLSDLVISIIAGKKAGTDVEVISNK